MAGYIGSKSSVTQVDGYSEAEADAEFVTKTGDTMSGNLNVTGTVTSDGLTVDGVANFNANNINYTGSSPRINFFENDATDQNTSLINTTGDFFIRTVSDDTATTTNRIGLDHSTGDISFYEDTGTTAKFFWDASAESLGIGTSSPSAPLTVKSPADAEAIHVVGRSDDISQIHFLEADGTTEIGLIDARNSFFNIGSIANIPLKFATNNSERMRIHAEGDVLIGQTTQTNGHGKIQLSGRNGHHCATFKNGNDGGYGLIFRNTSASQVGSVTWTASSTSYNTSSDYRLKENVVDLTGASARVNQLNPSRFNFIADDTNTLVDGFLAHEVATVVPEAIHGTKDAMKDEEYEVTPAVLDDDGNVTTEAVMGTRSVPDYQGIDQSKLVPLLTAALQEALTEIASLKTRVEALEA